MFDKTFDNPVNLRHCVINKNGDKVGFFYITELENGQWEGKAILSKEDVMLYFHTFNGFRSKLDLIERFEEKNLEDGFSLSMDKAGHK